MQRAYEDARDGRPADYPFFSVHTQSAVDPRVAPRGQAHPLDLHAVLPLRAGRRHLGRAPRRDRRSTPSPASPNTRPICPTPDHRPQVLAPPDIEARFGLTGGHIFQGELVPEQAFDMRPVPGSKAYEGPIPGLFLCGSGAWPGGCVMGAPGHNAAHEAIGRLRAGEYE